MISIRVLLAGAGAALILTALRPQSKIESLAWLAGCWERASGERILEEQWLAPRGGAMLGMSRTTRGGRVVDYEFMRIYERDGKLVFDARPSGQQAVEFVEAEAGASAITFANPTHDFPQRIRYAKGAADSLFARIEGTVNGNARGIDFRMKRAACGGS